MNQRTRWLALSTSTLLLLGASCADSSMTGGGGSSSVTASSGATQTSNGSMATTTGAGETIPDPGAGDAFDQNLGSVEPNDTPSQATPLGTSMGPNLYVWVNGNAIGGGDDADYFVFKSGPMPGEFQLGSSGLCYGPPLTNLTATLWKVVANHQIMPPIHTWTTSTGSCLQSMAGDAPVEANTVYLLGVFGTGGVGSYAA
jgi:hypothetical protein